MLIHFGFFVAILQKFFENKFMKLFFNDYPILVPIVAALVTEALKLTITYVKSGKISRKDLFNTGGIPSGHSSFVSALVIVALILKGVDSFEFAISFVFGFLVLYDAVKLRGEAGKHAIILNHFLKEKHLNERLGHTLFEVLTGVFLGSGLAFLMLSF